MTSGGFHSSDCEDWSSMECDMMLPGRSVGVFEIILLLSSYVLLFKRNPLTLAPGYLPWWHMKQCQYTSNTLNGITFQDTDICRKCHFVPPETVTTFIFCLYATSYITVTCIYLLHLIDSNNIALFLCFVFSNKYFSLYFLFNETCIWEWH